MAALFNRRNQLQWLALLVIAVVLPTVSLLWFMSRVIANERLVVQQKLSALYRDKLTDATAKTDSLFRSRLTGFDQLKISGNPYGILRQLVFEENAHGVVIWHNDGSLAYPSSSENAGTDSLHDTALAEAWQEEFARKQFTQALQLYDRFSSNDDPHIAIAAIMGKTRCLSKLGQLDLALQECQRAAFSISPSDSDSQVAIENARLLLLSLLNQAQPTAERSELFQRTIGALTHDLYNPEGERALLPAAQNLFIAKKVLATLPGSAGVRAGESNQLARLVSAEELSLSAAETYRPFTGQSDAVFKTPIADTPLYALRHQTRSATLLVLLSDAGVTSVLSGYRDTFAGSEASYRVLDASGEVVAGNARPQGQPFTIASLPQGFPGWKIELYFEGGDVFEKAAHRQIAVYMWTGLLVILMIVIAASFATRTISRQIRLNEMKNDFIATVSHELKTPLASMRVLVDTLLEGNVKDEAQVRQYLQLTAKENERLSRMIDNFLTFSRMERNKVAFAIADAKPALIAQDAVESLKTKYNSRHCPLTVDIAENLPDVQADHDAIVTVLVNLLDNACKYTGEYKQVGLRVYLSEDAVCFAASDNGIGIARRHLRKIFDRFYQVDNSLSRKAEGCGLGLSIVKFIVDAHHGKINVESKPGKGSTFTVQLPVSDGNGD